MLKVSVISPEAVLFQGETDSVVAPAYDGEVGILTGHAPLMALLGDGQLRLGGGSGRCFTVSGGFMQVLNNDVRIVTEKATAAQPSVRNRTLLRGSHRGPLVDLPLAPC